MAVVKHVKRWAPWTPPLPGFLPVVGRVGGSVWREGPGNQHRGTPWSRHQPWKPSPQRLYGSVKRTGCLPAEGRQPHPGLAILLCRGNPDTRFQNPLPRVLVRWGGKRHAWVLLDSGMTYEVLLGLMRGQQIVSYFSRWLWGRAVASSPFKDAPQSLGEGHGLETSGRLWAWAPCWESCPSAWRSPEPGPACQSVRWQI